MFIIKHILVRVWEPLPQVTKQPVHSVQSAHCGTKKKEIVYIMFTIIQEAAVVVITWQLDLQLPMQSLPITTDVESSNLDQGEVYNIMW